MLPNIFEINEDKMNKNKCQLISCNVKSKKYVGPVKILQDHNKILGDTGPMGPVAF